MQSEVKTVEGGKDVKYALADVAIMNARNYNHHERVKINDVLSDRELADFQMKVGDRERW